MSFAKCSNIHDQYFSTYHLHVIDLPGLKFCSVSVTLQGNVTSQSHVGAFLVPTHDSKFQSSSLVMFVFLLKSIKKTFNLKINLCHVKLGFLCAKKYRNMPYKYIICSKNHENIQPIDTARTAERAKELEANRLLKIEQNLDAERYKKDRWEQKMKQAETKKANADFFLKELKKREDIKRDDDIELKEKGKAELRRIANEIKKDNENKRAKVIDCVISCIHNSNDNIMSLYLR
ncbi:hypothetical protein AGLY_004026 [Aphis glycines]|uniref:Uncharacterized protein n=1 Tax=Aphis glycines TaxID=307491 RepID=A0A6G0TXT3_APHGL|nr:hypothetical protein AGLY_004026 [Aphis glycines]